MTYDLTVIIPAFNVASTISKAIDSIFENLKKFNVEVIVIDDKSQDNTVNIIHGIITKHPHVKLFCAEVNGGAGVARNVGMAKALGRFITFLDADDYYLPTIATVFDETLKKSPDIAVCSYSVVNEHGEIKPKLMARDTQVWNNLTDLANSIQSLNNIPGVLRLAGFPWIRIVSKEYSSRINLRFSTTYVLNDVYAHFQSLLLSKKILLINSPAVCHVHEHTRKQLTNTSDHRRVKALSVLNDVNLLLEENSELRIFKDYIYAFQDDLVDWVYANADIHHKKEVAELYTHLKKRRLAKNESVINIHDKKVILYGLGWQMMKYLNSLATNNNVVGFMDSQLSKSGHEVFGIKIYHPSDKNLPFHDYIVICSAAYDEIYKQLSIYDCIDKTISIEHLINDATIM